MKFGEGFWGFILFLTIAWTGVTLVLSVVCLCGVCEASAPRRPCDRCGQEKGWPETSIARAYRWRWPMLACFAVGVVGIMLTIARLGAISA